MAIKPKGKGDEDKLSAALTKIREEDPTIKMEVNPETKQTLVYGVGEQQLDVMVQKLKAKYKIEVDLTDPIIPYREKPSRQKHPCAVVIKSSPAVMVSLVTL